MDKDTVDAVDDNVESLDDMIIILVGDVKCATSSVVVHGVVSELDGADEGDNDGCVDVERAKEGDLDGFEDGAFDGDAVGLLLVRAVVDGDSDGDCVGFDVDVQQEP